MSPGQPTIGLTHTVAGPDHDLSIRSWSNVRPLRHVTRLVVPRAKLHALLAHLPCPLRTGIHKTLGPHDLPVRRALCIPQTPSPHSGSGKCVFAVRVQTLKYQIHVPSRCIPVTDVPGQIQRLPEQLGRIALLVKCDRVARPVHAAHRKCLLVSRRHPGPIPTAKHQQLRTHRPRRSAPHVDRGHCLIRCPTVLVGTVIKRHPTRRLGNRCSGCQYKHQKITAVFHSCN